MFKFINRQSDKTNANFKAFDAVEKKVSKKTGKTTDHLQFVLVEDDSTTIELAQKIGQGIPLVVNFDQLDVKKANKMLFFLSGVLFPLGGEVIEIKDRIYLFASQANLQDNSLRQFVSDYR